MKCGQIRLLDERSPAMETVRQEMTKNKRQDPSSVTQKRDGGGRWTRSETEVNGKGVVGKEGRLPSHPWSAGIGGKHCATRRGCMGLCDLRTWNKKGRLRGEGFRGKEAVTHPVLRAHPDNLAEQSRFAGIQRAQGS